MRKLDEIIIHCTATRADFMPKATASDRVAEVRRWHVEDRGWKDIGYHYLIDRDGTLVVGRPLAIVGAHTQGHNTGTVGIALFGGHGSSATDQFEDNYTPAQRAALESLVTGLKEKHGIKKVSGHNQYSSKACPGFQVGALFGGRTRKDRAQVAETKTAKVAVAQVAAGAATVASPLVGVLGENAQIALVIGGLILVAFGVWFYRNRLADFLAGAR